MIHIALIACEAALKDQPPLTRRERAIGNILCGLLALVVAVPIVSIAFGLGLYIIRNA